MKPLTERAREILQLISEKSNVIAMLPDSDIEELCEAVLVYDNFMDILTGLNDQWIAGMARELKAKYATEKEGENE